MSRRCVFLEVDRECLDLRRQWKHCLAYADHYKLKITAYAGDPQAAASVVDSGNADVVLAAVPEWRGADPQCLKGKIRFARGESAEAARDRQVTAALELLERATKTGDMGAVAEALSVLRHGEVPPPRPAGRNVRTRPVDPRDHDPSKPIPKDGA